MVDDTYCKRRIRVQPKNVGGKGGEGGVGGGLVEEEEVDGYSDANPAERV